MEDPLVVAVRQLLPLVRDMLPRHPTADRRINLIKRSLDAVESALEQAEKKEPAC